ncbi:oxidoreductase, partial [Streptomyces sp. Ru62]
MACGAALAALTVPAAEARPLAHGTTGRTSAGQPLPGTARTDGAARGSRAENAYPAAGDFRAGGVHWAVKDTGTPRIRFRGLAAVDRRTAWLAGTEGTVLRTTDGGGNWRNVSPPGAADLQFRDVTAFDARRAVVLAIGEGEASRVYRTDDGGTTWTESFRNTDPKAFYD